jgi:hypothetical protein
MRIIVHPGYAKCASTSLQAALSASAQVHFVKAGRHGNEHIALPLKIKGIDTWTRQHISERWVEDEYAAMLNELATIRAETVALSSERLMDLSDVQMVFLKDLLSQYGTTEVVVIKRDRQKYLQSTWTHSVYHHDLSMEFSQFCEQMAQFSMERPIECFRRHFTVHVLDMDELGWQDRLADLYGSDVSIGHENVGVPHRAAEYLSQIHREIGSERFKSYFGMPQKGAFAELFQGMPGKVAPFDVPIAGKAKLS